MSFDAIKGGKTGDKEGKVGGVVVLHTEVVHHQDESDGVVVWKKSNAS